MRASLFPRLGALALAAALAGCSAAAPSAPIHRRTFIKKIVGEDE